MKYWLLKTFFKKEFEELKTIIKQKNARIKNLENALIEMKSCIQALYERDK